MDAACRIATYLTVFWILTAAWAAWLWNTPTQHYLPANAISYRLPFLCAALIVRLERYYRGQHYACMPW